MGVIDVLKSAQFVVDAEESEIARRALNELQAAGGRPDRAGWLAWDDVKDEWDDNDSQEATGNAGLAMSQGRPACC